MLEQPDIGRHPVAALSNGRQRAHDPAVKFPGIGLPAHVETGVESEFCRDHAVHLIDLLRISFKQGDETCFCSGRSPAAQKPDAFNGILQFTEIHQIILQPKRSAFPDGHQLSGLIVRISQCGHIFVLLSKIRKSSHQIQKSVPNCSHRRTVKDQIRIIRDIAARSSEMQDPGCGRCVLSKRKKVRHDIVPHFFFSIPDAVIVDMLCVSFQFPYLFRRNGKSHFALGSGESCPESAPCSVTGVRRKQ